MKTLPHGCAIVKTNEQHAYLQLPAGCTLAVDDDYNVGFAVNTFF